MTIRPLIVAVVGAIGVVGRIMIQVLAEREFLVGELRLFASERSAGWMVLFDGRTYEIAEAMFAAFEGVDFALFLVGVGVSRELVFDVASCGVTVIDNSSVWRMESDILFVVSQVNADDFEQHEGIIANSNCSTMQLVPVLMALRDTVGLERVVVDTYQAVSGIGAKAIAELEGQVRAYVAGQLQTAVVYFYLIAFNALPEIDVFLDNGYMKEEWKVVTESCKILHLLDFRLSCTAVRIPVFTSHSEVVYVETSEPIMLQRARQLFAQVSGVVVQDDFGTYDYPFVVDVAGRDEIFVGRVRQDLSIPDDRGLALWVVSDNVRKGVATNAVELAEVFVARDWVRVASRRSAVAAGRDRA